MKLRILLGVAYLASGASASGSEAWLRGMWVDQTGETISFGKDLNFNHSSLGQGRVEMTNEGGGNVALEFSDFKCVYLVTQLANGSLNFGLRKGVPDKSSCPKGQFAKAAPDGQFQSAKVPEQPQEELTPPAGSKVTVRSVTFEPEAQARAGTVVFSFSSPDGNFDVTVPFTDAASPDEATSKARRDLRKVAQSLSAAVQGIDSSP